MAQVRKNAELSIRNISFYSGAGSHEKTAPAPYRQSTCATLTVHLVLVHRKGRLVYVEGFGVWGSGEFIIFVVENNCCIYEYKVSFTCSCRGVFRWLQC